MNITNKIKNEPPQNVSFTRTERPNLASDFNELNSHTTQDKNFCFVFHDEMLEM